MKVGLIISNDWELFGDGSGNYFEIQHKPLELLLSTVENYGAKLTVMAEVAQQWAHERICRQEGWAGDIVEAWDEILKATIRRGHDVQLHLHPQWNNAEYVDNKWRVVLDNWAISSLSSDSIRTILREGKAYLENLLRSIKPSYECIAFRAGDYCIEPSGPVIEGLIQAGILCDSSITKGMYKQHFFDYRDADSNFFPWFVSHNNIKYKGDKYPTILEIPIYSYETLDSEILRKFLAPRLFYFFFFWTCISAKNSKWLCKRTKLERRRYAFSQRPWTRRSMTSPAWWFSKLISKTYIQLDYDVLPPEIFVKFIQAVFERGCPRTYKDADFIMPLIAIGHVKRTDNCDNIERILQLLQRRFGNRLVFWTLSDAVKYWLTQGMTHEA
jgi:hypothetical protein